MKCVVIYFSLTSNTEKIAKAIQAGVKQAAGHCDIFPIKEINPRRLSEYDLIGLGSPIMGPHLTSNVRKFIKDMRFVGGKHAFPFCTHCTLWYNFFPSIVPMLKGRGLTVIGWGDWYGSSFGPLRENTPYWTDGHPDEIDLQEAEAFGREMVERSRRISAGETNLIPEVPVLPSNGFNLVSMPDPSQVSTDYEVEAKKAKFSLNYYQDKCLYPKCRLCMDICPLDGIDLSLEPRVIPEPGEDTCMNCMMCDQVCPTGAIEVDEACLTMERPGVDKHHDYKVQRVRQLEKEGFRRLIPEEKVAYIEGAEVHQVYNKRPRFVIGKGRPYGIDPWSWRP